MRCVHCGIITNGILCAGNIVVDGARQTNTGNSVCGQICCATERAVTADDNQTLQTVLFAVFLCQEHAVFCAEFCASCGIEHGTASLNDAGYAQLVQRLNIIFNQTAVTALYAVHIHALFQCSANNSTYCCVHSRGIAAAC